MGGFGVEGLTLIFASIFTIIIGIMMLVTKIKGKGMGNAKKK